MSTTRNTDFRYDLKLGEMKEAELADIFTNKKIEVKTDLFYQKSGNIYVEFESRGKVSGIATSEADFYCYILPKGDSCSYHLFDSQQFKTALKKAVKDNRAKVKVGGDNGTSKGILINFEILLKYI